MRYDKLSASLHAILDDVSEEPRRAFSEHGLAFSEATNGAMISILNRAALVTTTTPGGVMADRPTLAPVRVFLRCHPDAELDDLSKAGVKIDRRYGSIRPATVPIEALEAVSEHDLVEEITASIRLRPLLDRTGEAIFLTDYVQRTNHRGAGVVTGVVDTGIDALHPAFAGRILSIWDQTVPGPGVPEGAYGVEHVNPGAGAPGDRDGHGTHVAGIAAGDDPAYPGVAPGASLVVVKTDFDGGRIASGVEYVFRLARDHDMPAVVNLSLGGHNDPHDGTDPLSKALDQSTGPGRIVCASAGNEGADPIHAARMVPNGGATVVEAAVSDKRAPRTVWINVWYPADDAILVTVTGPAGDSTTPQGPIRGASASRTYPLTTGPVKITSKAAAQGEPGHNVVIELQSAPGTFAVPGGLWTVEFTGHRVVDGTLHAWLIDHSDGHPDPTVLTDDTYGHRVGSPGAAASVITVGASVSRSRWEGPTAAVYRLPGSRGGMATFSSPGPLRGGGLKPDVTAPGSVIVSARSSTFAPAPEWQIDNEHVAMQGTSMSCPVVTGLVALLLEGDANLDPSDVRRRLIDASAIPHAQQRPLWDASWGHGVVDARRL